MNVESLSLNDKIQKLFKNIAIRKDTIQQLTEEYDEGLENYKNYWELLQEYEELGEQLDVIKEEYANIQKNAEMKEQLTNLKKENKEDGSFLSDFLIHAHDEKEEVSIIDDNWINYWPNLKANLKKQKKAKKI